MMTSITTDQYAPAEHVTVDEPTYVVSESRSVVDIDRDGPWHSGRSARLSQVMCQAGRMCLLMPLAGHRRKG
jgi:hypothetical protein